ncbi:histone deacetylase, partial [bacterium]|nr:histone deacetylase [bacterium]
MSKTAVIWEQLYTKHVMGEYHPESPQRLVVIKELLDEDFKDKFDHIKARPATHDEVAYVHTKAYIKEVAATKGNSIYLDPDTSTSPESYDAALLAVGGGIVLTENVVGGKCKNGFAFLRPPGHHAEADTAMGFCLFNNIVIAAEHAIKKLGVGRIAIIDFDVHHGNGTQNHFYKRNDVLYISSHRSHFYPGSGHENERGDGDGYGYTLNVPLSGGTDDEILMDKYKTLVFPALDKFRPELILVSAGYDAHSMDPLGGMNISTDCYRWLSRELICIAKKCCDGKIAFFLEGGYNLA